MIILNKNNIQAIQALFAANKQYQDGRDYYQKQIKQNNQQILFNSITAILTTLQSQQTLPMNKLLAMRYFKQCISFISYGFLTLASTQLALILFNISLYDHQNKQQQRGRTIFLKPNYKLLDHKQLQIIGYSFHKLVLQCYLFLQQWIQLLPYHKASLPSIWKKQKQQLDRLKVKFPQKLTYFKTKDTSKFKDNYNLRKNNVNDIKRFYQYIFHQIKSQQNKTINLLKNIIKTGDLYCVDYIIQYLKQIINQNQIDLSIRISHEIYLLADYEFINKFYQEILLSFLKLTNQITQKYSLWKNIYIWVMLIKDKQYQYTSISISIYNCLEQIYNNTILDQKIKHFQYNFKENNKINQYKKNNLNFNFKSINQLQIYIKKLQSKVNQKINNTLMKQKVCEEKLIIKNSKLQLNLKHNKQSFKATTPSFSENLKLSFFEDSDKSKLISDINVLKSIRKSDRSRQSSSCKSSTYNYSIIFKRNSQPSRNKQIVSQYSIQSKLQQPKIKQFQLKDSNLKYQNQYMLTSKIKKSQKPLQYQQKITKKPNQILVNHYDDSMKNKFHFPTKTKKQLLKNKTLLFKNTNIEVGLITVLNLSNLQVNIYITPLTNYQSIETNIRCPQWITCNILTNQKAYQLKASTQYIINVDMKLLPMKKRKHFNSLPQMTIIVENKGKYQNYNIFLPIFITKFCQQVQTTYNECQKIINENTNESLMKKGELNIAKNYEVFKKYFPKSVLLNKIYAFKIGFENQYGIIAVKLIDKGQIINLQFYPLSNWKQQNYQLIKDAYISLLCV